MNQVKQFAIFLTCAVLTACGGGGGVIEIDAAPEVSLRTSVDLAYGTFEVFADFSESVVGFELDDVIVTNGDLSNFSTTTEGTASGSTYSFDVTPQGSGEITLRVPAGVAQDDAGNPNEASATLVITADLSGPSVTLMTAASDPVSGAFNVTASFSEDVEGFGISDLVVSNADVDNFTGSGADYSFSVNPTADGTVTVDVPAGVAYINNLEGGEQIYNTAAEQLSITADLTVPTILSLTTEASEPVAGVFSAKVVFSEAVEGFTSSDISVGGGQVGAFSAGNSGAEYVFDVTPLTTGTITVDIGAGVAQDPAGNPNTAATQLSVQASLTAPTVSLTTPNDYVGGEFAVTATFSEDVTDFELADIDVENGTVKNFSGSGSSYTFDVTPISDGPVTVDVAAGVAENVENTGNLEASTLTVTADFTEPSVTLTTGASGTLTGSFSVTATFSEDVTDFEAGDVSVDNGAVDNFSGFGTDYSFDVIPTANTQGTLTGRCFGRCCSRWRRPGQCGV